MTAAAALPFERMILVDDPRPRAADLNMAVDETLLAGLTDLPLLRVYRWVRPAVSIGCFDPVTPVASRWPGRDIVRRWTGGGVVEHGCDLTFSLLVPRPLPLALLTASESYRVIHGAVALALSRAGFQVGAQAETSRGEHGAGRACFDHPVPFDLLLADRKIAGGAQRRTRKGLLHQGSVQNTGGERLRLEAVANALPGVFAQSIESRVVSTDELASAARLVSTKYGTAAWRDRF